MGLLRTVNTAIRFFFLFFFKHLMCKLNILQTLKVKPKASIIVLFGEIPKILPLAPLNIFPTISKST